MYVSLWHFYFLHFIRVSFIDTSHVKFLHTSKQERLSSSSVSLVLFHVTTCHCCQVRGMFPKTDLRGSIWRSSVHLWLQFHEFVGHALKKFRYFSKKSELILPFIGIYLNGILKNPSLSLFAVRLNQNLEIFDIYTDHIFRHSWNNPIPKSTVQNYHRWYCK